MTDKTVTTQKDLAQNVLALQEAYKNQYTGSFEIAQRWEEICLQAKGILDGNN